MAVVGGVEVRFEGFDEFRRLLRAAEGNWDGALREANRQIAQGVAGKARGATETRQQAKAAGAITGRGDRRGAAVGVNRSPAFAQGAFYGALQYPQFPAWVGNSWEVGGAGGPYAINPTIRDSMGDIVNAYGDAFEKICALAFPNGRPVQRSQFTLVHSNGMVAAQQGPGAF